MPHLCPQMSSRCLTDVTNMSHFSIVPKWISRNCFHVLEKFSWLKSILREYLNKWHSMSHRCLTVDLSNVCRTNAHDISQNFFFFVIEKCNLQVRKREQNEKAELFWRRRRRGKVNRSRNCQIGGNNYVRVEQIPAKAVEAGSVLVIFFRNGKKRSHAQGNNECSPGGLPLRNSSTVLIFPFQQVHVRRPVWPRGSRFSRVAQIFSKEQRQQLKRAQMTYWKLHVSWIHQNNCDDDHRLERDDRFKRCRR